MFRSFGTKAPTSEFFADIVYGLITSGNVANYFGGLRIMGAGLMQCALEKLKNLHANGCVLLGDPSYYGRFGFKAESILAFPGVPPESIFKLFRLRRICLQVR